MIILCTFKFSGGLAEILRISGICYLRFYYDCEDACFGIVVHDTALQSSRREQSFSGTGLVHFEPCRWTSVNNTASQPRIS